MPQLIGVKSLSQTCLDFVINNMAVLCEKPTSDLPTTISNQSSHNPFDQLPSKFLEEIISALQTKKCLKQFLGLLVAPQLQTLDLRYLSQEDNYTDLELNLLRCIYLKNLSLRWSSLSNDFLKSVIPMFVKLQVLDISNSAAGDSSLEVIGTYCTNLRELEVMNCKNITDIGVKGLCVSSTTHNLGREGDKLGLHKSLLKLGSLGTEITNAGIQLGLETFRSLQVWDLVTVQILAKIHTENFLNPSPEIPKYSLKNLKIALLGIHYIPKTFGFVLSLCPFVIEVEINTFNRLTDSDLLSLLSLEKLRKLKLDGYFSENSSVTFGGGVTPILKAFGNSSLKALSLSKLRDVNILVITQLCPNLHSLNLYDNLSYSNTKPNEEWFKIEPQVLKQLEKLSLSSIGKSSRPFTIPVELPLEHFILLLSTPSLVDIDIGSCCTLNDGVLQEVVRVQNFDRLENLTVTECHNVTEKGIDVFMNAQNPLKKIVLHWCRQLTKKNVEHWENQAKMNNWQILIEYEEYVEEGYSDDEDEDFFARMQYEFDLPYNIVNSELFKDLLAIATHGCEDWQDFLDDDDDDEDEDEF